MPAPAAGFRRASPRERLAALAAVLVVQLGLALALLSGFDVRIDRPTDAVERLIAVALQKPPPPPPPRPEHKVARRASAAPKEAPAPLGGSPGPRPVHRPPPIVPVVALNPTPAPSGGGAGSGPAAGSGSGGGSGGNGSGDLGEGGTDLVQIAGAILPSDYPRDLSDRGVGGRVGILFTVAANGRVTRCSVTRSSGVPELDALTCRLIQQRFVYRPSTDARGRPIADEVDGEHDWIAARR